MPARYVQAIYKQYSLFLKDQKAQEAAAAEDVIEELEDGAMAGTPRTRSTRQPKSNLTARQKLMQMQQNIAEGREA